MEATRVGLAVDTYGGAIGDIATLIDDGTANDAVAADLGVRQDDRAVDVGALLDTYVGEQQRLTHHRAGDDAAPGHHGVDGAAAAAFLIEHELRRRLLHLIGPDRPVLVVDVELGSHVHQLEIGVVIGIDGADVAPVALRARLHVLKRVGEYLTVGIDRFGKDVFAEVVSRGFLGGICGQHGLELLGVEDVNTHRGENGVGTGR